MYHSRTLSQKIPDPDERGGRGPLAPPPPPPKSAPEKGKRLYCRRGDGSKRILRVFRDEIEIGNYCLVCNKVYLEISLCQFIKTDNGHKIRNGPEQSCFLCW